MGLQLSYTNRQGIELLNSYWKITQIHFMPARKSFDIEITGYKDVSAKGVLQPLEVRYYSLPTEFFDEWYAKIIATEKNIMTLAYEILKSEPKPIGIVSAGFFATATDLV